MSGKLHAIVCAITAGALLDPDPNSNPKELCNWVPTPHSYKVQLLYQYDTVLILICFSISNHIHLA